MNLSNFVESLLELIMQANLTPSEFAKQVGCGKGTISRYLHEQKIPEVGLLIRMADFFECSTDYLLGRETEKYPRVLKANAAFPVSRRAKKLYTDEICSKIMTAEGSFSYFSDAVLSAKKHFDENRFYLTPKGIAFYYEKGLLCPEKEGSPAFVIPYKAIEKLI